MSERTLFPEVGEWYLCRQSLFEVVARDDRTQTVDIQYYDGDIEELDLEGWMEMSPVAVNPPKDCSGPFDEGDSSIDDEAAAVFPERLIDPLEGHEFYNTLQFGESY